LKTRVKKYLLTSLRLLFSALALLFVFHKLDKTVLLNTLLQSNVLLVSGACLFYALSKILSAFRLNNFIHAAGIHLTRRTNLKLYWLGMFYNLLLPGGIGGDGYKVFYLHRNMNVPAKKSILALLLDRLTGLFALGIMVLVLAFFLKPSPVKHLYLVLGILIGSVLFYYIVYKWFNIFYALLQITNMQSFGVQALQLVTAWMILKAVGQDNQIISYLFVFLISSVVAAIPFTLGGVGAREITFLYASDILRLNPATSVSLSLLFLLITVSVSLTGFFYAARPEELAVINERSC
jgi:uncharacterized membrane protein YbhN (UPF0104 family)